LTILSPILTYYVENKLVSIENTSPGVWKVLLEKTLDTTSRLIETPAGCSFAVISTSAQGLSRNDNLTGAHLMASCLITPGTKLWTRDGRLRAVAQAVGIDAGLP
jgi:hypothetical protein